MYYFVALTPEYLEGVAVFADLLIGCLGKFDV